jgi:hypothetical protein
MPLDTLALTRMLFRTAPDAKLVTLGAQSTYGVLTDNKQIGEDGSGEPVTVHEREVFVAAGSFSAVNDGAVITVGGVAYTVRGRALPRENGDIWAIRLTRVDA